MPWWQHLTMITLKMTLAPPMTCLRISDWTLGTSPSKNLLKHAPMGSLEWRGYHCLSPSYVFNFFFIHRPRFVLYNVITRTQCPLSYLSFILSYVQLMVPTPRLLLSCSVVLFCLTLGYSLLFLGVGGLHMPLFHQ